MREELRNPLQPAITSATVHLPMRLVWDEILRRGEEHKPGFAAALFHWRMAAAGEGKAGSALEAIGDCATAYLRRAVRLMFSPSSHWRREEHPDLLGQIPLTLSNRCREDAFMALASAIEGKLDIMPRAIRDDLVRQMKQEWQRQSQREKLEIIFQERPQRRAGDQLLVEAALRETLRRYPEDCELIEAYLEVDTQKEAAARLGITDRTVRNRLTRLQDHLNR
jgi:hypothetical protein